MKIMNALTLRHLRLNRKRTMITLLGIIVSVAMVTAVAGFAFSFLHYTREVAIAEDGEWHVFYSVEDRETAGLIADSDLFTRTEITYEEDTDGETAWRYYQVKGYTDKKFNRTFQSDAAALAEELDAFASYNYSLLRADGLFGFDNYYTSIFGVMGILVAMIVGSSVIVVANAFYISTGERTRQYGVLKSVGATRKQVRNSVLFEGTALAVIAIPLGLLFGYAGEAIVLMVTDRLLGSALTVSGVSLVAEISLPAFGIAAVISCLTILLSAWLPARRAAKIAPVEAIRQSREVRIRPGRVRTSRLTEKIFGFEGALAAKSLKRSRGKYRATVIALTVSIVLFLGATSFGDMLTESADMVYEDSDYNLILYLNSGSERTRDELEQTTARVEALSEVDGTTSVMTFSYVTTPVTEASYLPEGLEFIYGSPENYGEGEWAEYFQTDLSAVLYALSDDAIAALCTELGIAPAEMHDGENPRAIHINGTGAYYAYDAQTGFLTHRQSMPLYQPTTGSAVTLDMQGNYTGSLSLEIAGEIVDVPETVSWVGWHRYQFGLIVSQDVLYAIREEAGGEAGEDIRHGATVLVRTEDSPAVLRQLQEGGILLETDSYYSVDEALEQDRNTALVIKLFIYGFVVLLSIIALTSVIGTISTSIGMRRREFATLQSVGMTPGGIRKMLNLESLFYGLKALAFGLPLGLLTAYGIHRSLRGSFEFAFIWPWTSMLIVVGAVLLITFITMHYSRARQRKDNIVDTLRSEVT